MAEQGLHSAVCSEHGAQSLSAHPAALRAKGLKLADVLLSSSVRTVTLT